MELKFRLAGIFGLNLSFPGQNGSIWRLTAAQRALLLKPAKEPKVRPMKDLIALTQKNILGVEGKGGDDGEGGEAEAGDGQ